MIIENVINNVHNLNNIDNVDNEYDIMNNEDDEIENTVLHTLLNL